MKSIKCRYCEKITSLIRPGGSKYFTFTCVYCKAVQGSHRDELRRRVNKNERKS